MSHTPTMFERCESAAMQENTIPQLRELALLCWEKLSDEDRAQVFYEFMGKSHEEEEVES